MTLKVNARIPIRPNKGAVKAYTYIGVLETPR